MIYHESPWDSWACNNHVGVPSLIAAVVVEDGKEACLYVAFLEISCYQSSGMF